MSYMNVVPVPRQRPGPVRAAVALLYLVAVMELLSAVFGVYTLSRTRPVLEALYRGTSQEKTATTAITIGSIVGISISVIIVVCFLVLAVFVGRGSQAARVVTWVIAGLFAVCAACSLGGSALSNSLSSRLGANPSDPSLPTPDQVSTAVSGALPAWVQLTSTVISVLVLGALVIVIIMLALPASNAYYRPAPEVWVPPTGYWPNPGGPGAPLPPGSSYPPGPPPPPGTPSP
jgi:hypothetical protein